MSGNFNNYEEQIDPSFGRGQSNFSNVGVDDVTAAVANVRDSNNMRVPSVSVLNVGLPTIPGQSNNTSNSNSNISSGSNTNNNMGISNLDDDDNDSNSGDMLGANHRRPVSTTKRAAQNRSAQKAFRQRRERYIKDLETQAAEVPSLKQTIDELRAENLRLRDYTIALQSKLIELGSDGFSQGEHAGYSNKLLEHPRPSNVP